MKKAITILDCADMMSQGIIKDLPSDRSIIDIGAIRVCDTARADGSLAAAVGR